MPHYHVEKQLASILQSVEARSSASPRPSPRRLSVEGREGSQLLAPPRRKSEDLLEQITALRQNMEAQELRQTELQRETARLSSEMAKHQDAVARSLKTLEGRADGDARKLESVFSAGCDSLMQELKRLDLRPDARPLPANGTDSDHKLRASEIHLQVETVQSFDERLRDCQQQNQELLRLQLEMRKEQREQQQLMQRLLQEVAGRPERPGGDVAGAASSHNGRNSPQSRQRLQAQPPQQSSGEDEMQREEALRTLQRKLEEQHNLERRSRQVVTSVERPPLPTTPRELGKPSFMASRSNFESPASSRSPRSSNEDGWRSSRMHTARPQLETTQPVGKAMTAPVTPKHSSITSPRRSQLEARVPESPEEAERARRSRLAMSRLLEKANRPSNRERSSSLFAGMFG
eukprot:TRINITY_DN39346_c0_g2_i2.p1 TRINITY_DN39346_c0_g2~~TRINITY_DN39346_c0_g2_i2.p1  ORF type:complete len:405 (-),score=79.45 TRINITY_DN39346_c0_g2_i2:132-1346(-)